MTDIRVGYGYDVHRLVPGRKLILGGVEIPFETGLLGHSDADVLLHAVIDALFGAAALGNIGSHFPDTDPRWAGADSWLLLKECGEILSREGWCVGNIDAVVAAQKPKLAPYIGQMCRRIGEALNIDPGRVSVKGKTEEGLGFTGSGEGMAARAVCLILRD